jgi:SLOG cluster2
VTPPPRPLTGCVVNLSISESDDSIKRGFPSWQVNRVTLQLVAALFGQGASVVFGHDWRDDGVMEAVYSFARQVQAPIPPTSANFTPESQPLLRNLLPWPESPYLEERELERLSSTLRVEAVGLPNELKPFDNQARQAGPRTPLYRYLRARGLTFLRHRLTDVCHVRICLGGRRTNYDGRYPGVVEEALLAMRINKPLFLASFLGGAAEQVVDAIERKPMMHDFCQPTDLQDVYQNPPVMESMRAFNADRAIDRTVVWSEFSRDGIGRLAASNGLTDAENEELLHTPVIDQVIELVLVGLSRIHKA